jgi:hypothetical protein
MNYEVLVLILEVYLASSALLVHGSNSLHAKVGPHYSRHIQHRPQRSLLELTPDSCNYRED